MAQLERRSQAADRLAVWVETSVGSGAFELDERLRVEQVRLASDATLSTARIAVRLDDGFDADDCRRRYRPDLRLRIGLDAAEPGSCRMLFEGYPPVHEARWDGLSGRADESFGFTAESVYGRLSRARECQIFGRYVRNGQIEDGLFGDPAGWADKAALATALPCTFNADGLPNCAPIPMTVHTRDGQTLAVYLFTYDDDPLAEAWTYARALRYLVWFYMLRQGPVFAGNVWHATESTVDLRPEDAATFTRAQAMERALLRAVEDLNCEATNLVEALGLWAASAGLHVTAETVGESANAARTQLRVWSAEAGPVCRLRLARGGLDEQGRERYPVAGRSVREVLSENNTYAAQVRWSEREVVHVPIVIGDVKRYEMTVELVPGWLPIVGLDNVAPEDRAAAKAAALVPEDVEELGAEADLHPWFRRYHRRGAEFALYSNVARRWVLNEHGRYEPEAYNRNAPFDDYRAFDFSQVADRTVTRRGVWMRRPRPMSAPITRSADGEAQSVQVEISFDGGVTWHRQSSHVQILRDECGLWFDCENPTQITLPDTDPREQNLWYALVDQTFRVRVTGLIDSDERLMTERRAEARTGSLVVNAQLLYLPGQLRFASRAGTSDVLSGSGADGGRDDTAEAVRLVERTWQQRSVRRIRALPAIPWVDTEFRIGDRIAGVCGRDLRFATTAGPDEQYPAVIGKRYEFSDDRLETVLDIEGLGDVEA